MKKIFPVLLSLALLLTLSACGDAPATTAPGNTTQEAAATTAPTTAPTEPTTAPTEPTTAPTEPTTAPTEPTTAPTEPTTAPTEPTTAPTEPPHVCAFGAWEVDLHNHWTTCADCGQQSSAEAHTLGTDYCCTVCGAEVISDEDAGYICVYQYDSHGISIAAKFYSPDGTLYYAYTWENSYNAANKLIGYREYCDGALIYETTLDPITGATLSDTNYWDDGTYEYFEYDAEGAISLDILYDADGTVLSHLAYTSTYDENGMLTGTQTYENGILIYESTYATLDDGWYYLASETEYNADGSRVVTEYDELGAIISQTYYDAGGNTVDSSAKFDPEACAPLFGTWTGEYVMDGAQMGSSLDVRFDVVMSFDDQGNIYMYMAANMEDMKLATMDVLYSLYADYGMSQAEVDALFQSQLGMTVEEYVLVSLEEQKSDMIQETTGVYYMEDGILYISQNWSGDFSPTDYTLEGDTLTITDTDDSGNEMQFTLIKTIE